MLRRIAGLIALAACALLTSPVGAAISYSYVATVSNTGPQPGTTVTVSVFLQETVSFPDTTLINPPNGQGLLSAGVAVQQMGTPPANATTISTIAGNNSAIGAGGGFGASGSYQTNLAGDGSKAALLEKVGAGVTPGPSTNGSGRILLGTLTLTAGAAYTATTFSIPSFTNSDHTLALESTTGPYTFTKNLGGTTFDLDPDHTSPTYSGANDVTNTFTITVVPEPGSMMLCGLAVCGGLFGAYRRRMGLAAKADLA
jgi:hypothetical protein